MGSGQRGGGPEPPPLSHLRLRELPFHLREERADSKLAEDILLGRQFRGDKRPGAARPAAPRAA